MGFTRYATAENADVLEIKGSKDRIYTASLDKMSDYNDFKTDDGFLYVRIRAISSRVNQNYDGWPTVELAGSPDILSKHHSADGFTIEASSGNPKYGFATFMAKPIFVDHNNGDPKKTRGMIVDSKFRVLDKRTANLDPYWSSKEVDASHLPACEIELLLEIDADRYPKFANAVKLGHIDGFSMGANVEKSTCSHCGNVASTPDQYCSHLKLKGHEHEYKTASGEKIKKKSYENVSGVQFFEISGVFNPADETALTKEVIAAAKETNFYNQEDPNNQIHPVGQDQPFAQMPDRNMNMHDEYNPNGLMLDQNGMPIDPQTGEQIVPNRPGGIYNQQAPTMNDPRWSSTHLAENPLPQSMMIHAPDEVNTLRDESICPVCGSAEMDGEACEVCGYVAPPKEFDNPDLNEAQKIRDEMKQQEETQAQPQPQQAPQAQQNPAASPQMPNKPQPTANVNNRMSWTPLVTEKTAAKINKVENPVLQPNTIVTNQPSNQTILSDQTTPVTSAMLTAQRLMATAQRNHIGESMSNTKIADGATPPEGTSAKERVNVTDVGGFDDASNEAASKSNTKQVDVTGIGSTGVEGVEPDYTEELKTADPKSDDSGFNTDKTTEDSGPTKTFGDSDGTEKGITDPVTSDPFPATEDGVKAANRYYAMVKQAQDEYAKARLSYDNGTLEQNEQQGNKPAAGGSFSTGNPPIDSVATPSYKREPVNKQFTTPEQSSSGPTKTWTGTDGNGVNKQQDPVTKDKQETGGVSTPDVKLHTGSVRISSIRLAELEIELGLTPVDEKYNRIAALDNENETVVLAQLESLSKVKTAGYAKLAQQRTSGVTKLPRFARVSSDQPIKVEASIDDYVMDAAIFSR